VLVELSVVEQRYHAVMEVLAGGVPVSEVAERYGVSRKSVHAWLNRYQAEGLPGLSDRSHRPHAHPLQLAADLEARLVEMRRAHPRWGPRRLLFELAQAGVDPVPSRSTAYRVLVRHQLVTAKSRKRRRQDYRRWERPAPMQLWQLDVMGSVFLTDGSECKLISGVDDHSRFCVIADVVARATGRAVCQAFADALNVYGCPEQVLTDNGRQLTGKYGRPRPAEVLFDRICRRNGIEHLLAKVRSPTTTGKVERWHQTIQRELLADHGPFASLEGARAAMAAWREEYNQRRPHQSLDMASPADRFRAAPPSVLPLWLPGELTSVPHTTDDQPEPQREPEPVPVPVEQSAPVLDLTAVPTAEAVELDRVAPVCGNLSVGPQQFWVGRSRAGMTVSLWIDTRTVHLSLDGRYYKTLPSRFSSVDLARLRGDGARPAGPPPARPAILGTGTAAVEVDRVVNWCGLVTLAGAKIPVGSPLAGRQVILRVEEHLVHVITDGQVWRTIPHTIPPVNRARLRGQVPAPLPTPRGDLIRVQRRVSCRGGIQVISQRVQVGLAHRNSIVTVEIDETVLRLYDQHDTLIKTVPRTSPKEVSRYKAYARQNRARA
jgi:transposase InsO family protein